MGGSPFGHIRVSTKEISHAPTAQLRRQGCFECRRVEEAKHEPSIDLAFDRVLPRSPGPITTALCRTRGATDQGTVRAANRRLAGGPRDGPGTRDRAQRISGPDACTRNG